MKVLKILRYIGLFLGFQASVLFLIFLISDAFSELLDGKTNVIPILLMMILAIGGFVWAVAKPSKGSLLMIGSGAIMLIYLLILSSFREISMSFIFGLPFIVPGLLFYYSSPQKD